MKTESRDDVIRQDDEDLRKRCYSRQLFAGTHINP